jgi:hypothetical protein
MAIAQPQPTTPTTPTSHGIPPRGLLSTPSSSTSTGRFGRLFRRLPVFECRPGSLVLLGAATIQPPKNNSIDEALGVQDDDENTSTISDGSLRLPAGYTYLGQFVDHDITFDPASSLTRQNDPDALTNFRTPRFDLDSLYGDGPSDQPFMYQADGLRLALGDTVGPDGQLDLLRIPVGDRRRAVIGDPRNDENKIVSQLQVAFIHFHNKAVDWVQANERGQFSSSNDQFKRAQQLVRWHYQWVVVHDFLRRVVGDDPLATGAGVVDDVLAPTPYQTSAGPQTILVPRLRFYHPRVQPFMPVEFSVAAYRYGHSAIRPSYHINNFLLGQHQNPQPVPGDPGLTANRIPIFTPTPGATDSLGGFDAVPLQWGVDWSFLLDVFNPAANLPQPSYKIDTSIAHPLGALPARVTAAELVVPGFDPRVAAALPVRNLLRGLRMGLPAGEHVALGMGLDPDPNIAIDAAALQPALQAGLGITQDQLDDALEDFEGQTPLWYYILKEAELADGAHLGPVGGRIVAETFVGLLAGDPFSFLNVEPNWQPIFQRRDGSSSGAFTLADLIAFALS